MIPERFSFNEKLYQILSRINPLIDEANLVSVAIENLETAVEELNAGGEGPDLVLLFENGLI